MSLFGWFGKKGIPIDSGTLVKRMSSGEADWECLSVDGEDHLTDVWKLGDVRCTFGNCTVQECLMRCTSNADELRREVKKRLCKAAFYITPRSFEVRFPLSDGRMVSAELRFRAYGNIRLTDWISNNITEPSRNYTAEEVSELLGRRRFSSREDVAEFFELVRYEETEAPVEEEPPVQTLEVGAKVFDRYVIQKELGAGGMGKVFLASNRDSAIASRQQVVLKVLHDHLCGDEKSRQLFIREANTLSDLRDDRIAACYECRFLGDVPVLVMEYIEGVSLDEYLKQRGGTLGEAETRELLRPIAQALDYAHGKRKPIYHLDVKPLNIIVRTQPKDGLRTCLLDFGISRRAHADGSVTMTMSLAGTRPYMSPEYWNGEDLTPGMDLYSLAVTAYECLTGRLPYPDGWKKSITVAPIGSDTAFAKAVMQGIGHSEGRPATCRALIDPPITAKPLTSPTPPSPSELPKPQTLPKTPAQPRPTESPKPPLPPDLVILSRSFLVYRQMLAQSANKLMRTDEARTSWLKDCQVQLRDLTADLTHADERALTRFFNEVKDRISSEKSTPDEFFVATDRLVELRAGLPEAGGVIWQALSESVSKK